MPFRSLKSSIDGPRVDGLRSAGPRVNIPAVVGTGLATQKITTGQRVRVNGPAGIVEILE